MSSKDLRTMPLSRARRSLKQLASMLEDGPVVLTHYGKSVAVAATPEQHEQREAELVRLEAAVERLRAMVAEAKAEQGKGEG